MGFGVFWVLAGACQRTCQRHSVGVSLVQIIINISRRLPGVCAKKQTAGLFWACVPYSPEAECASWPATATADFASSAPISAGERRGRSAAGAALNVCAARARCALPARRPRLTIVVVVVVVLALALLALVEHDRDDVVAVVVVPQRVAVRVHGDVARTSGRAAAADGAASSAPRCAPSRRPPPPRACPCAPSPRRRAPHSRRRRSRRTRRRRRAAACSLDGEAAPPHASRSR